jgi:hypothetical protein
MTINENELAAARVAWGNGMIAISKAYEKSGIDDATIVAKEMLDQLYGFEFGPVLFKPTLSGGSQTFRSNKEGALSYFIGNNPMYPLDSGFGIKSWREVKSETSSIFVEENIAMWMGWVTLTGKEGDQVKVDKSWGYKKTENGALKIVLHHSSLPYEV